MHWPISWFFLKKHIHLVVVHCSNHLRSSHDPLVGPNPPSKDQYAQPQTCCHRTVDSSLLETTASLTILHKRGFCLFTHTNICWLHYNCLKVVITGIVPTWAIRFDYQSWLGCPNHISLRYFEWRCSPKTATSIFFSISHPGMDVSAAPDFAQGCWLSSSQLPFHHSAASVSRASH